MRRFLQLILFLLLAVGSNELLAQERTVSGRVTSTEDGTPLPGVNVVLKGTASGVVTDAEGSFRLNVPAEGGALVFSFIGLKTQEVEIGGRSTFDVVMTPDATQLSEVVVTALGIKREVKSLPYAAQSVTSEKLNMTRANNVNDALAGKVAGIQVRGQSGAALGRNSSIRIRGAGSLVDKEPLYIVDGTPVTNSQDFNPDDIETINVLKGPAATAVYGQRGDAGVVMITTKRGTQGRGLGIQVNNNVFFDNVYVLPQYQNDYAGGSEPDLLKFTWQPGMPAEWNSLDGAYYHDYTDDASWGPRMVGQQYIPWYAWAPGTKYTGKTTALVGQPNNIRDFYQTGVNRTTNISFGKATETANLRVSVTNQDQSGIMPYTGLKKNTLAANTSVNLSKLITVGANINFVKTSVDGEFDDTYSNQSTGSFNQWFHRNLDMKIMKELEDLKSPEGRLVSWNHQNPNYYVADSDGDGVINGDKFYRGYYWYNHYAYFKQIDYQATRNRIFGDINLTLNLTDNLKASVFYRKNQANSFYEQKRPSILPHSFYVENRPNNQPQYDYFGTALHYDNEDNVEFLIGYNKGFLDDKLTMDISAGGNLRSEEVKFILMNTRDGLVVPNLFTISNSKGAFQYRNERSQKQVRSLYARGNFGYNETFFLDFSVRNDWSSALPANNNSYLYPSIGASIVFSEFTSNALPVLSFGKLRASYAQVGSDLRPYQTVVTYTLGNNQWSMPNGSTHLTSSTPDNLVDPNIRPSLSSAMEFGADFKFLENRIGLSATYFDESKIDEILSVAVSGASGFQNKVINAGQIDRNVIELQLDATPITSDNFEWNTSLNWSKTQSTIVELSEDIDAIQARDVDGNNLGATFSVGTVFHVVGQQWGQIRGKTIKRIDGSPVLNGSGLFIPTETPVNFGSVLPDFTGGFVNNLRYKNFNAAFNIDFQQGGKFYSLSDQWGTYSGLTRRTAGLNDKGNPIRDAVEDGGGVHVVGVSDTDGDGIAEGTVDMYVPAQLYYHQFYSGSIADEHIYDLSFVKLRELSIGYQIPVRNLGGLGKVFTSASVSLVGRNLWLISSNVEDFDPSEISGSFGENGQFPSVRSYGVNIRLGL